jgi:hypothetical protein
MKGNTMENKKNNGAVNSHSQTPTLQYKQLQDNDFLNNYKTIIYNELSQFDLCDYYLSEYSTGDFKSGSNIDIVGLGSFTIESIGSNGDYAFTNNETNEKHELISFLSSVWDCPEYQAVERISKDWDIDIPSLPFTPDALASSSDVSGNYLEQPLFSFYKAPISNTSPLKVMALPELVELINGDKYKDLIVLCRNSSKADSDSIKKNELDYVTFSGSFGKRSKDGLSKYSGLICIDFDSVELPEDTKHLLSQDISVPPLLIFTSPSGKGIKVVYKVAGDQSDHSQYFDALCNYLRGTYNLKADSSGKDVPRACFLSHDPDLYFNDDYLTIVPLGAEFISEYYSEPDSYIESNSIPTIIREATDSDIEHVLSIATKIIERSRDGEKRYELWKASYLLGGYVGGGVISEADARNTLREAIDNKPNVMSITIAYRTIDDGIREGKKKPLYSVSKWKVHYESLENSFFDELLSISFPLVAFPEQIVRIVEELYVTDFYPIEYTAASILFAASVAFGSSLIVHVKFEWEEQANLFITLVGPSGVGKSSPMSFAINPLEIEDLNLAEIYNSSEIEHETINSNMQKSDSQSHSSQLLVNDFTLEALFQVLINNPFGVGLYKDELIGWINEMSRYRYGSDIETWNSIFSSKSIRVDRKSDSRLVIPSPKVSIIGSTQLNGAKLLTSNEKEENGFAHRILFVYPDKFRINEMNDAEFSKESSQFYNEVIHKLLDCRKTYSTKKTLFLNDQSLLLFKNFYNSNQIRKADPSLSDSMRGMYSKMDIHVIRLALTLQALYWACDSGSIEEIEMKAMQGAIDLVEYFSYCAIKVKNTRANESGDLLTKKQIAKKMAEAGMSLRDIESIISIGKSTIGRWLKE